MSKAKDRCHLPGDRSEDWSDPRYVSYKWRCLYCNKWLEGSKAFAEECPEHPDASEDVEQNYDEPFDPDLSHPQVPELAALTEGLIALETRYNKMVDTINLAIGFCVDFRQNRTDWTDYPEVGILHSKLKEALK